MKLFKFLLFKLFKFLLFKLSVCLVPLELKSVENEKILESFYDFQSTEKCISLSKSRGESIQGVCVCNLQYCHQLNPKLPKVALNEALLFVTSRAGKRFDMDLLSIHEQGLLQNNQVEKVKIIPSIKHQSIIGFGGAFTDAAAINLYKLQSPLLRDQLLDSYFSKSGSEYSLGRVPIASTDFSESVYSYNDNPGDLSQSQFSIQVDKSKKIPMILAALSKSVTPIALFASSWAPPVWMTKENSTIDCIIDGDPGSPSDPLWQSYSLYLSNFFRDYLAQGIKFWAMTVQNEPVAQPKITGYIPGIHHFQSMRLTSDQEKLFIKNHLGPRMAQDHPYLKIIAFDDQKGQLDTHHAPLDDPEAAKYIAGFGIHWYSNTDFILGNGLKNVRNHFEKYPEKFILATEACEGFLPSLIGTGAGTALDDANKRWQRAENYARDIIGDLDSNVSGWTDWNLFLSEDGGPNWAKNNVDAPILVSDDGTEFFKQPMYYILAHFSKYLRPGAVRVELQGTFKSDPQIVAFTNLGLEGFEYLLIIQNRLDRTKTFLVQVDGSSKSLKVQLEENSVATLLF